MTGSDPIDREINADLLRCRISVKDFAAHTVDPRGMRAGAPRASSSLMQVKTGFTRTVTTIPTADRVTEA